MRQFDVAVIGSGPAGQRAAIQAAKLGKRVGLIESKSVVGGAAINTGTIPSKALREAILRAGQRFTAMPTMIDFAQARSTTFETVRSQAREVIDAELQIAMRHLASNGIELIHGLASFRDDHTLDVVGPNGSDFVAADFIVISVGSRPAKPKGVPFDECTIMTSDEVLDLDSLPRSMLIVGGGVIGTEYASMLQALGVKITLIEGRPRLLDFVDEEITEALQYHLRQGGMTLRMGERVATIKKIDAPQGARTCDEVMAEAVLESGKTLRADALLYCIGRQGSTDALSLHNCGLEADSRGRIKVNEHYQTEKPHIYAVGDVIGFPALASTSMEQGRLAACHMFGEPASHVPELFPYGIYAVPEISMVGWTEQKLTEQGIPFESGVAQYREIARGQLIRDELGMLKMLIHQESRVILGVHVIGTGATELIHIGQCAMAFGATVDYFIDAVFNYPTLAECYKTAALNGRNKLRSV